MKQTTKSKIEKVETLNDYLEVLSNSFKCKECTPGKLIKDTLIRSILSKLSGSNVFVNENLRVKVLEAPNIEEFIKIIKTNFNTSVRFSPDALKKLVANTEALILLTSLKEN